MLVVWHCNKAHRGRNRSGDRMESLALAQELPFALPISTRYYATLTRIRLLPLNGITCDSLLGKRDRPQRILG